MSVQSFGPNWYYFYTILDGGFIFIKRRGSLAKWPGRTIMFRFDPLILDPTAQIGWVLVLIRVVVSRSGGSGSTERGSAALIAGDGFPRRGSPDFAQIGRSGAQFDAAFGLGRTTRHA